MKQRCAFSLYTKWGFWLTQCRQTDRQTVSQSDRQTVTILPSFSTPTHPFSLALAVPYSCCEQRWRKNGCETLCSTTTRSWPGPHANGSKLQRLKPLLSLCSTSWATRTQTRVQPNVHFRTDRQTDTHARTHTHTHRHTHTDTHTHTHMSDCRRRSGRLS